MLKFRGMLPGEANIEKSDLGQKVGQREGFQAEEQHIAKVLQRERAGRKTRRAVLV